MVEELVVDLRHAIPLKDLVKQKEWIADKMDGIRETLIRQEYNQKGKLDDRYYQMIDCTQISCLGRSCEINGQTVTATTDIYSGSLPGLVPGLMDKDIKFVSDAGIQHTATRMNFKGFVKAKLQYVDDPFCYSIIGSTIYLKNLPTDGLKFISMAGILTKPSTACNWKSTDLYPVPSAYKLKLLVKQDILSPIPKGSNQNQEQNDNQRDMPGDQE